MSKLKFCLKRLFKMFYIVLSVTAISLLVGFLMSGNLSTDITYAASVNMVFNEEATTSEIDSSIRQAVQLATADSLFNAVIAEEELAKYNLTRKELKGIKVTQGLAGTGFVNFQFSTDDPQKTINVLNVYISKYTESMLTITNLRINRINTINVPEPLEVDSTSKVQMMLMAAILGFLGSCFIVIFPYLIVDRVFDEADLEDIYKGKVMGVMGVVKEKKQ